ncbi:MAG: hypothetical protein WCO63_11090 [Bacteroidota bacterium]
MRLFWITLIILICHETYSQETKFVLKVHQDFKEEYYVLKSDKKIKHGTYVKYKHMLFGVQLIESGLYKNGLKTGLWEFYNQARAVNTMNSIRERVLYKNGKKNGIFTSYYLDTIPDLKHSQVYEGKRRTDSVSVELAPESLKLKLAGIYKDDQRIGEWSALNENAELFQKFDFSKGRLLFDSSLKDSSEYNKNRVPLFIGGLPCLIDFLADAFDYTLFDSFLVFDSTSVVLHFKIDSLGHVSEAQLLQSGLARKKPKIFFDSISIVIERVHIDTLGHNSEPKMQDIRYANKKLRKEAIRLVNLTEGNWIPALKNGNAVSLEYKIKFTLKQEKKYYNSTRGRYFMSKNTAVFLPVFE